MWSLAVEVAFYVVLPLLAYLLLVVLCRRRWRPVLLLAGPGGCWRCHAGVADPRAHHRLPARRGAAVAADVSAVVHRRHGARGPAVDGCARYALACMPLAVVCYFIASTPIAGEPTTSPANCVRRLRFEGGLLRGDRDAGRRAAGARRSGLVRAVAGQPADGLPRRDLLRDLPDPSGDDGTRDGRDPALSDLHRLDAHRCSWPRSS